MFTAATYKTLKSYLDRCVYELPGVLRQRNLQGQFKVDITSIGNEEVVIRAFNKLEKENDDFNRSYEIDCKKGVIFLDYKVSKRAKEVDEILASNKFDLVGYKFTKESDLDDEILEVRGFKLVWDEKHEYQTIQLDEEEYT